MFNDRPDLRQLYLVLLVMLVCAGNHASAEEENTAPEQATEHNESSTTNTSSVDTSSPAVLPEVGVSASRIKQDAVIINRTQTITTIEAKELERTQPNTIFEAVRDTPGIAIEGGPRPSGMSFNIRGFSSNDDVQVRVDNVPKGFEKYRFGGTFIEPDLLKSIEVQRGPQIASGSGSLGGTVLAKTKDAADLLRPGQRYGARIKLGYASNNDEVQRSYLAFARPVDAVDILYNRTYRNSNDITHTDGSNLPQSQVDSRAQLLKVSIFPTDTLEITNSITLLEESGLQPYDALTSDPMAGNFGYVLRDIEDLSVAHTVHWNPENRWIDLTATLAWGHTRLTDTSLPGMNRNHYCSNPATISAGIVCGNDYHKQKVKGITLEFTNTSHLYTQGNWDVSLLTGLQYRSLENETRRFTDTTGPGVSAQFPADGFWAASTSGKRAYTAAFVQPRIQYGRWGFIPGVRVDWYKLSSTEKRVKNHLAAKGLPSEIDFAHTTYSMGLTFDVIPKQLTLFANYGQGFRPPSINDYFAYGSRAGAPASPPFLPYPGPLGLGHPYGSGYGKCNTPSTNFLCGDAYKLQTSESSEIGAYYQHPSLFGKNIQVTSKFTYFHTETKHLLRYFEINDIDNIYIPQDGWEKRNGTEFEGNLMYKDSYIRANYSRVWGTYFEPDSGTTNNITWVPANTLNITIGTQLNRQVGINASYRKVSERDLLSGGTQDGYELFNAGGFWSPTENLTFRLIGENLKNKDYYLNGGGDFSGFLGNRGPGRNIRFITEITF